MIEIKEEDIEITNGEDDPIFNGIFIGTGCECDGYSCGYYGNGVSDNYIKSKCYIKKNNIKSQILANQKLRQLVEESIKNFHIGGKDGYGLNVSSNEIKEKLQSLLDEANK